jgi:hypothetical protein
LKDRKKEGRSSPQGTVEHDQELVADAQKRSLVT